MSIQQSPVWNYLKKGDDDDDPTCQKKRTSSTSGPTAESLPASVAEKSQRNQVTQPTIIEAVGKRAPPCTYAAFQTANKLSFLICIISI